MKNKVVTRMAPSPTGNLHIGTVRATLFPFMFARKNNGSFILRIDDTDKTRSKKEYEEAIISGLAWLGIEPDELYRQSERTDIYKSYIEKLIAEDKAYVSEEQKDGVESNVIRFRNTNETIRFNDEVRGEISVDTSDLGDFVIAKKTDEPLYHLASVIDDHEMKVTHVIRGEDHISNTPRQILLIEAIGAQRPVYAHFPTILGKDGKKKLSKRDLTSSFSDYINKGYLPEAIINFLALQGWHPSKDDREIFSPKELIELFELDRIQKGGAIFDEEKLDWINKEHLDHLSDNEYLEGLTKFIPSAFDGHLVKKMLPVLRDRLNVYSDFKEMHNQGEFSYILETPSPSEDLIVGKSKASIAEIKEYMKDVVTILENVKDFTPDKIKESLWDYSGEKGRGKVLWPMRVLLTGKEKSPDPFNVAYILGKNETIARLKNV